MQIFLLFWSRKTLYSSSMNKWVKILSRKRRKKRIFSWIITRRCIFLWTLLPDSFTRHHQIWKRPCFHHTYCYEGTALTSRPWKIYKTFIHIFLPINFQPPEDLFKLAFQEKHYAGAFYKLRKKILVKKKSSERLVLMDLDYIWNGLVFT